MNSTTNLSRIKLDFSLGKTTSFGGLLPILQFCQKIELRKKFETLDFLKKPNSKNSFSTMLEYFVIGWLTFAERVSHFQHLSHDPMIQKHFGETCPHYTTLHKEYSRMARHKISKFLPMTMMELATPLLSSHIILDLDSTIESVYGNQEKAEVGVNPGKPGRKSYQRRTRFERSYVT